MSSAKHYTETTYLLRSSSQDQGYVFLRKRGETPSTAQNYFYSAKHVFPGGESAVVERQISGLEYSMLLSQADPARTVVRKKVRVFQHAHHYFEIEQWIEPHPGLVVLKTSVDTSSEKVELPPFVRVRTDRGSFLCFLFCLCACKQGVFAGDVTDDTAFSTYSLASSQWPSHDSQQ